MQSGCQIALKEFAQCASRSNINLNGSVERHDLHSRRPFALVYQGTLHPLGTRVAVKTIIPIPSPEKDTIEEAVRQVSTLSQVQHKNVLPLLGITTEFYSNVSMVSAWMENGNAHDYVQDQSIDPRPLIDEIAQGLLYLHSHELGPIVHGNLKGSNVLISTEGHALVADFGLSRIFDSSLVASGHGCAPNWMAPENLESGEVTAEGDVWAFAMTIFELFTRKVPFHGCQSMAAVVFAITEGQPNRPNMEDTYSRFTDDWWDLCCWCWNRDLSLRGSMSDIVEEITFDLAEDSEPALKELTTLASRFSINLNGRIQRHEDDELSDEATTVYKGTFLVDGTQVAVKTIAGDRSGLGRRSLLSVKKNIQEIQAWTRLRHENILPVLGITTEFDSSVAVVSEWMDRGNAHDYVQDESVDPRPVIVEIALGLQYLHNHMPSPIFHGDLMGTNVMISRDGHALLTHFGLYTCGPLLLHGHFINNVSYVAPEHHVDDKRSAKGDAWSFCATALELFIRKAPSLRWFSSMGRKRISRPSIEQTLSRLTDEWWDLCCLCWNRDPTLRPSMSDIVKVLLSMSIDHQGQNLMLKGSRVLQISAIELHDADDSMSAELTVGGQQYQISGEHEDGVLRTEFSPAIEMALEEQISLLIISQGSKVVARTEVAFNAGDVLANLDGHVFREEHGDVVIHIIPPAFLIPTTNELQK